MHCIICAPIATWIDFITHSHKQAPRLGRQQIHILRKEYRYTQVQLMRLLPLSLPLFLCLTLGMRLLHELCSFWVISLSSPSTSYNIWYMMFNLCSVGLHSTHINAYPRKKHKPSKTQSMFFILHFPFALHVNEFVGVRAIRLGAFKRFFICIEIYWNVFHLLRAGFLFNPCCIIFSHSLAQSFKTYW